MSSLASLGRYVLRHAVIRASKGVHLCTGVLVPGSIAAYHLSCVAVYCKTRLNADISAYSKPFRHQSIEKKSSNHLDWTKLWKFISPDLILLLGATASAIAAALLNIAIPLELGSLVTAISNLQVDLPFSQYVTVLTPNAVKLALLYMTQGVFTFSYISILAVVGERFAVRLRNSLFQTIMKQDIQFFDNHRTGELVNRLSADVQQLKSSFKLVISQGLRSSAQIIGCLASLYLISPQMTGVVLIVVPSMVAMGTAVGSILRAWSREAQHQVAIATSVADEAISNVRTVRAFAMEEKESSLYNKKLLKAQASNQKLGIGIAVFQGLSNVAINGLVLGVITQGGLLLSMNSITPGDLMAFLVATQTIQKSLGILSVLFGQLVQGISAGSRVLENMYKEPLVPLVGGKVLTNVSGHVEFNNVTFAYPTRSEQVNYSLAVPRPSPSFTKKQKGKAWDVISKLSLVLPAGKITALCGLSGAGKSTVAALLERFYEPNGGYITLDNQYLNELDPSWLRGKVIGFIDQEPILFATSIGENIRYGKPSATDEEVIAAAKLANAHSFIQKFPDGYSTNVGERGIALSGGQKQRVAIARALLKDPVILILDEATSALDAHSESLVQQALERACQGRTVLIIAHRLSTIREADQIAVIHKGALQEVGTHQQLLNNRGIYNELIRRQTILK